jgi:hypothetical protein
MVSWKAVEDMTSKSVARGDTPPPADDLAKFVDYESIGTAIGESVFLSSQGFDEWPTLEQCKAAGVRATREIASELTDALRWREHICAVPPGDGRVVVMHRDRYEELIAKAGESLVTNARGDTPPPQTAASADEAFEKWWAALHDEFGEHVAATGREEIARLAFYAAARAAVGDSPPTPTGAEFPFDSTSHQW